MHKVPKTVFNDALETYRVCSNQGFRQYAKGMLQNRSKARSHTAGLSMCFIHPGFIQQRNSCFEVADCHWDDSSTTAA